MESHLPAFGEKNPQLDVVTQLIRSQHPHLKGLYRKHLSLSLMWSLNKDFFYQMHREQKRKGDMREEYGSRRRTSTCNQAKKFFGKKGCETEDKTGCQTP